MIIATLPRAPLVRRHRKVLICVSCTNEITNPTEHAGGWKRSYCIDCQDVARLRRRVLTKAVKQAIAAGTLLPPAAHECIDCGSQAYCYDHRDWQEPLNVVPVCRKCNIKRGCAANLLRPQ